MTRTLPSEFFSEFFRILKFSPEEAEAFRATLHELSQRRYLHEQLQVLPDMEREAFNAILDRDDVSAETMNEFLDERIEAELQQELWQKSMLYLWQKILEVVGESATSEQKEQIKQLVRSYLATDLD